MVFTANFRSNFFASGGLGFVGPYELPHWTGKIATTVAFAVAEPAKKEEPKSAVKDGLSMSVTSAKAVFAAKNLWRLRSPSRMFPTNRCDCTMRPIF